MGRTSKPKPINTYFAESKIWKAGVKLPWVAIEVHSSRLFFKTIKESVWQRLSKDSESKYAHQSDKGADAVLRHLSGELRYLSHAAGLYIGPKGLVAQLPAGLADEPGSEISLLPQYVNPREGHYLIGGESTPIKS